MTHKASDIRVLSGVEVIRKRPGMYIGDLGHLGAARVIKAAIDILTALTVNRESGPIFTHHAFLDVTVEARDIVVVIDYNPVECEDIALRCRSLADNRDQLSSDPFALDFGRNSTAPVAVLSALSDRLRILRTTDDGQETVLQDGPCVDCQERHPKKGAYVAACFVLRDLIDISDLSRDYLEGFVQGVCTVPGLVVRDVSFRLDDG